MSFKVFVLGPPLSFHVLSLVNQHLSKHQWSPKADGSKLSNFSLALSIWYRTCSWHFRLSISRIELFFLKFASSPGFSVSINGTADLPVTPSWKRSLRSLILSSPSSPNSCPFCFHSLSQVYLLFHHHSPSWVTSGVFNSGYTLHHVVSFNNNKIRSATHPRPTDLVVLREEPRFQYFFKTSSGEYNMNTFLIAP